MTLDRGEAWRGAAHVNAVEVVQTGGRNVY